MPDTNATVNFDEAQATASGVRPNVPPPPDPTNPSVVAAAATSTPNYRSEDSRKYTLNPGGPYAWKPSQSDYYPEGSSTPTMYQMKTGLVPVAHAGQIPFAVLANREQAIAEQKQALLKQANDFDLYGKIGKAPDPYQESFRKAAVPDLNGLLDQATALHGGDRSAAINDPRFRQVWQEHSHAWENYADKAKYYFAEAKAKVEGIEKGDIKSTPEDAQLAKDLYNALGQADTNGAPDVRRINELGKRFEKMQTEDEWIQQHVLPIAAHAQEEIQKFGHAVPGPNGTWIMTKEGKKEYDHLINNQIDDFIAYHGGTREHAREKIGSAFAPSTEVSMEKFAPPSGDGSNAERVSIGGVEKGSSLTSNADGTQSTNSVYRATVTGETGGKKVELGPMPVRKEDGKTIEILPKTLMIDGPTGQLYIEGDDKQVQELDTQAQKLDLKIKDYTNEIGRIDPMKYREGKDRDAAQAALDKASAMRDKAIDELATKTKQLKDQRVPLDAGNLQAAKDYWGKDKVEAKIAELHAARGAEKQATTGGQAAAGYNLNVGSQNLGGDKVGSGPAGTKLSATDFDSQWAKLPTGGKLVGPDGVEYTKK